MHLSPRVYRVVFAATALVSTALGSAQALAQDFMSQNFIKPGQETFTLNLGGIINQFNTSLQLNGQTHSGSNIDLESSGLKDSLTSFYVSGTWRFLDRHRIDLEYFSTKRSGGRDLSREITIRDEVFPIGASVSTEARDNFLLGDYRYSFIKNDNVEVAGLIGIYGGQFKFRVTATGNGVTDTRTIDTSASTTVPMPLLGGSVDWYVNPQLKFAAFIAGMKANINDIDGSALVTGASAEYMIVRNLGLGLRYMYSDVDVDINKSRFNGSTTWRMNSVSLYAKLLF